MSNKFLAIWRDTEGSAPQKRHESKDEAIKEANRLARSTGEEYFVLEVVGSVKPVHMPVDYTEIGE